MKRKVWKKVSTKKERYWTIANDGDFVENEWRNNAKNITIFRYKKSIKNYKSLQHVG